MFTGLVEAVGSVREVRKTGGVWRLRIECSKITPELVYGQSVAVSGVCLSVVELGSTFFDVEMMPETASRTRFGGLKRGDRVNLERALRMGDRLDGHIVQGHVDGTATLKELSGNDWKKAWFESSFMLARAVVPKGSIAVDGVSLTVIDAEERRFSVGLIPATLEGCTLGLLKPGSVVNIETDIIGKYVERLLKGKSSGALTLEGLRDFGY